MKIAILGTGSVGTALATKLAEVGHDVTFGSRSPKNDLAVPSASPIDAVTDADVIVNATPGTVSLEYLKEIGADALGDAVMLDAANTFDGTGLAYPNDSLARNIQETFPALRVVKALNQFAAAIMVQPTLIGPSDVFISGNDSAAKDVVRSLLADLGWTADSVLDLGGIEAATGQEAWFLLFWPILRSSGSGAFNVKVVR